MSSTSPSSIPRVTPAELRSTLVAAERKVVVVDVRDEVRLIVMREGDRIEREKRGRGGGHLIFPRPNKKRKKNTKYSPSAPTPSRTPSTPLPTRSAPKGPRATRRSTQSWKRRRPKARPRSSCTARCRRCAARRALRGWPTGSPRKRRSRDRTAAVRRGPRSGSRCSTAGSTRGTRRSAPGTSSPRSSRGGSERKGEE